MGWKKGFGKLIIFLLLLTGWQPVMAQLLTCKAVLANDTLVLENSKIKRVFLWNNGALQSISLINKTTQQNITGPLAAASHDVLIPGLNGKPSGASFRTFVVGATPTSYTFLAAEVVVQTSGMAIKRVFKIYPNCPAIACDYYLKGKAGKWASNTGNNNNFINIENENAGQANEGKILFTDKLPLSGSHWQLKAVEFLDATDYNNNLVKENTALIYRQEMKLRGNLLFAHNPLSGAAFFILKEAPVSTIQLYYQGFDFTAKWGEVKVAGIGISPGDVNDSVWVKGYSVVVGVSENNSSSISLQQALRNYQQMQRAYTEERDAMIVSNTWGDRNRDSRVNEKFILLEIEAAARLGITRLQVDDGWQNGVSSNSAYGGSLTNIWRNPNYWNADSVKFPGGLQKIVTAAKQKGIQVSLWFNPSTDSSFKNWEKDAEVLIAQYKKYGIAMWKIDGVQAADKTAEINFRGFLDKVSAATNYQAVFNLDVTAGKRFGYHYLSTYGNLFLENRYTDWGNYFPHFTLRNLWQLSAYLPPQRLQIEFLNKWRNTNKYNPDDKLAPVNYGFNYLFAITMVAQPLAWFEVSGLPPEAFATAGLIKKYKTFSAALHKGQIFPVGDEPNGFSWTGFQSMQPAKGYFIIFRESNPAASQQVKTNLPGGTKINLKLIAGEGNNFSSTTGSNGCIIFKIAHERSFAVYEYTLQ